MQEVITLISLMKEVSFIFDKYLPNLEVFCKASEVNQICIAVTESKTISPRTKNIATDYYNLLSFVQKKKIRIWYIDKI